MSNSVDLSAHASEITSAHQRILNNDPSTSWAIFGTALNVESQGSGGLEDLSDELMPASSQVGQVQGMLSGSHVTINARSEEDVDAKEIMDKVGRSSGAQYSYHTSPRLRACDSAKPAFGAGAAAFKKGATYGAPAVSKARMECSFPASTPAPALQVPATPYKPPFAASSASKPNVLPKPATAASSLGGTKPLFGGGSGSGAYSGRPVSSFFGARSPNTASTHRSPRPSPPASPIVEPTRSRLSPPPSYKSQQSERHAELEALRRGSRGPSPTGSHGGSRPSTPSRFSSLASNEPSSLFSQADQTKNELEMLRSRRLLNSSLGASSSGVSSSVADERRAELDAVRRARSGSQTSEKQYQQQQAAPPTHSWKQNQDDDQLRRQQQQQEEERKRQQQQQEEERKRQQQQDEQRKRQQQQKEEENRCKQLEEEDHRKKQEQQQQKSSRGQRARAVYDYEAEAEDELPFKEGEILYNVDQLDPGWWAAETEDGLRQGVFPANFVELIEDDNVNVQPMSAPGLPHKTPAAPAPPPMAPAPPPMAPAPPPMAPAPPPMAPPAPPLPMSFAAPPMAPTPPPMAPMAAPPMVPLLPPRGPPAAPPMAAPMLPPRNAPPAAPPAPPAAPSAPVLPPRGGPAPPPPPPPPAAQKQKDLGEHYATAVYDYDAAEDGELTFKEGEQITHIEFPSDEWWEGYNSKSEYGLFPANYVELEK
ncbi:hypothetical protein BX661DRAFT_177315 [Kickxella alabastrina]|uniref:uncharacterized protein n=1 Tax=Kickxella alabastrina TaxID=61397 RepID=UPI00221EB789|nr:uncharacterized protein BX661DRAFT_177315 [Kickxella alabastrina]KAI7833665.1 hypothetical protein BX661DRAFT_177315 [Kickxella alabastrina]